MHYLNQSGLKRLWAKVTAYVGNGTVTIKQDGTTKGTFTMNQSGATEVNITTPTFTIDTSDMCLYKE